MTVPSPQEYSSIPDGGVLTNDAKVWYINNGAGSITNLATGAILTGISPVTLFTYFPSATLSFD